MQPNGNGNGSSFSTVRLDLSTKLAVLSALIYSTSETQSEISLQRAVADAVRIVTLCDIRAKELKAVA